MEDLSGLAVHKLIAPHAWSDFIANMRTELSNGYEHLRHETFFRRKDGSEFWGKLIVTYAPWDERGGRYSVAMIQGR